MGIIEHEPVREGVEDHPALARRLLPRLREQRAILAEMIVTNRARDYPHYTNLCGKIDGLEVAIALCEQTQAELEA